MTELDLDAIEARAEATPYGPWTLDYDRHIKGAGYPIWAGDGDLVVYADPPGGHYLGVEVAALIVHARSDILALVARVRELEAREKRVREVVDWVDGVADEVAAVAAQDPVVTAIVEAYRTITTQIRAEGAPTTPASSPGRAHGCGPECQEEQQQ